MKSQIKANEYDMNQLMTNDDDDLEPIEKKNDDEASSFELNLTNQDNDDCLIERLCNKNTKYREIIKLIDKAPERNANTRNINNNLNDNTDETTQNIIDMFQSKPNVLQSKMSKSKFSFLYNEINSMCNRKNLYPHPYQPNKITPPPNSNLILKQRPHPPVSVLRNKPLTIDKLTKTIDVNATGLKRTMSSKNTSSSLRLQCNSETLMPWSINSSASVLYNNSINFKKIYSIPSLILNKKNYVSSFSNEYYESELNKFTSRLHKDDKKDLNLFNYKNTLNRMKKYDKKKNKSVFALLNMNNKS